ncbi:MAG TPA: hypothetical protein VLF39_02560 [Candidatus Saccharimonadales bacterium]|nr:hypothetical protein [Candidatus Saccharimonadales bacterium]
MNKIKVLVFSAIMALTGLVALPQTAMAAGSANLSFSPAGGSHAVGSTFAVSVVENSGGAAVNGVQADVAYGAGLRLVGKGCSGNFEIAAPAGGSSLACASVSPKSGVRTVGFVSFRVLSTGSASISFLPSSQVTASDGQGTNVWNGAANPAGFSLVNPAPVPAPAPATPAPKVLSDTKNVAPKKVEAKPVVKKSNKARMIWSIVGLIVVLAAAAVIFSESARKQIVAWAANLNDKAKTPTKTSKSSAVTASTVATTTKAVKKPSAKTTKKSK